MNHQRMVNLRAEKIERIAHDIPPATVTGSGKADLLVVSWGSTYGSVAAAVSGLQEAGRSVDHLHLRYLNPFPANLGTLLEAVPADPRAREQHGPALHVAAGEVPGRCPVAGEGRGPAVPRERVERTDQSISRRDPTMSIRAPQDPTAESCARNWPIRIP